MPRHQTEDLRQAESARLRALRATLGLSQRELADAFGVAGGAVTQWEAGQRTVPGPVLQLVELYERALVDAAGRRADAGGEPPTDRRERMLASAGAVAAWVLARILFRVADGGPIVRRLRRTTALKFVATSVRHKGLAMKWAQLMSVFGFVLSDDERAAFALLAVGAPAVAPSVVAEVVAEELGRTPRELFASWSPKPFAAASIGQVHLATLPSGARVAVKVQYPKIAAALEADLASFGPLARLGGLVMHGRSAEVYFDELRTRFREECDYTLEAANQAWIAARFAGRADVVVPEVYPQYSGRRVLTTRFVAGQSFDEFAATASQAARDRAGTTIWDFYYRCVLAHGVFNADLNAGNFLFTETSVAFLDFGRFKRLSPEYHRHWRVVGRAILEGDRARLEKELVDIGYVPSAKRLDLDYTYRLLAVWTRPCLTDGPFEFTPAYQRAVWETYREDPNLTRASLTPDMALLPQLLFGVVDVLVKLGARATCRPGFLDLLYGPDEPRPAPFSAREIALLRL